MIMQRGFHNFNYKALCAEMLARADLLAPRNVVLSRSNDVVMGTSSLEPTMSLQVDGSPLVPVEPSHTTGEQQQQRQWSEAELVEHLDALGKGKAMGKGKGKAGPD